MGVIIHNGVNYTRKAYEPKKPALVSWSTGTNDEITAMVNAYYNGILSLDEIKSVWNLGDCRSVDLAAMPAIHTTYIAESHRAQTVELQILDFEHDDLTTAIGDKTKALMTVDLKDCLRAAGVSDTGGRTNSENGHMSSSNVHSWWDACQRRIWCNNIFYNSFPKYIYDLIKLVNKLSYESRFASTVSITTDYCFMLSETEIFGYTTDSKGIEGSQYSWYSIDITNAYKLPRFNNNSISGSYWERSSDKSYSDRMCSFSSSGVASTKYTKSLNGIAPALCI